jgi:hypothetical protein
MTVRVHELHNDHPQIRAEDFRSPLVRRLSGKDLYSDGDVEIRNQFKNGDGSLINSVIKLVWVGLENDHNKCIKTYQVPVLTELATLGLACILIKQKIGSEITEVTRRGDRADYWLDDRQLMLEVSGMQSGDIEALYRLKEQQLLANPHCKDGYVCVAVYDSLESRLIFCKFK